MQYEIVSFARRVARSRTQGRFRRRLAAACLVSITIQVQGRLGLSVLRRPAHAGVPMRGEHTDSSHCAGLRLPGKVMMGNVAASSTVAAAIQEMMKNPNPNTRPKVPAHLRRAVWPASCAFGSVGALALPVGCFVARLKPNHSFKRAPDGAA